MNARWSTKLTGTPPMGTEHLDERIKDLEKKLKKPTDNGTIIKNIVGDRTRERKQHEHKANKLTEDLDDVKAKLGKSVEIEKEKMEAENLRHKTTMAGLEKGFQEQRKNLEKKKKELEAELKKEMQAHEHKSAELDSVLTKETGQAAASTAIATTRQIFQKSGEEQFLERLKADQLKEELTDQLTDAQTQKVAKTHSDMIAVMKKEITKQLKKELRKKAAKEGEEEEEEDSASEDEVRDVEQQGADGFTVMLKSGKPGASNTRRRAAAPGAIINDLDVRAAANKRAADEQLQPEDAGEAPLQT